MKILVLLDGRTRRLPPKRKPAAVGITGRVKGEVFARGRGCGETLVERGAGEMFLSALALLIQYL